MPVFYRAMMYENLSACFDQSTINFFGLAEFPTSQLVKNLLPNKLQLYSCYSLNHPTYIKFLSASAILLAACCDF